jgi:chemotaxis protein MotA
VNALDIATIIGIIGSFSLVVLAVGTGGGLWWFIDGPSAMIVFGGTFGAVLINYPLSDLLGVIKVARNAFTSHGQDLHAVIEHFVAMARLARKEGILALEKMEDMMTDPFLKKAVSYLIDGMEPAVMAKILETELEGMEERHRLGAEIFTTMGNFAPAMGMLGTLIGLVQMLMGMNDPGSIGPAMAVALVTTFYGVILSNLVFLPIAGKLRTRSARELMIKRLIVSGVFAIQGGDNPRVVEQKLHSFIAPDERRSALRRP